MKRVILSGLVVGVLAVAFSVSQLVWGKAHVPVHKAQVCHKGKVITVSRAAKGSHLGHGDCGLPACDFNNVFFTGDDCSSLGPAGAMGVCMGLATPKDIDASCVASRKP